MSMFKLRRYYSSDILSCNFRDRGLEKAREMQVQRRRTCKKQTTTAYQHSNTIKPQKGYYTKPKLDEISQEDIEFENMVNQKVFKILSQKNATYSKEDKSQPDKETNLLHAGHLKVRQPCQRNQKGFMNSQQHFDNVYSGIREEAATCDKIRRRLGKTTARWKRGSLKHQLGLELKSIPCPRRSYGSGLLEACGLEEEKEEEEAEEEEEDQNLHSSK